MGRWRERVWQAVAPPDADIRAQVFNVIGTGGVVVSVFTAITSVLLGAGLLNALLCLLAGAAALGLLWFVRRTGRYREGHLVTVAVVFLVMFPLLFFLGGGYQSGMPAFFVFAVVFTAFMLEGVWLWLALGAEVLVYTICCLVAWRHPALVTPLTELGQVLDVIYCVLAASLITAVTLRLLLRVYQRDRRRLAERNADLRRMDEERTEFLRSVAHELNTPLTVIQLHAEEGLDSPPATRNLQVVVDESRRLGHLVNQLLEFTRLTAGQFAFDIRPEPLSVLIQSTIMAYQPLLLKSGNTLLVGRADPNPVVLADSARVSQVLVNVIGNANRHTERGTVTVEVRESDGFAEVSVRDDGSGIAPEVLDTLLDVDAPKPRRSGGGSGLGLLISQGIVEGHGGRLVVESGLGEGTTVRFTLPLAPAAVAPSTS